MVLTIKMTLEIVTLIVAQRVLNSTQTEQSPTELLMKSI